MPKHILDILVIMFIALVENLILGVRFLTNKNTAIASNNTNGVR
jgi:hypothetical protein